MMPATIFLQQSGKRLFLLPGEEETPSVTIELRARKAYPHPSKLFDEHSRLRGPSQDSNLPTLQDLSQANGYYACRVLKSKRGKTLGAEHG